MFSKTPLQLLVGQLRLVIIFVLFVFLYHSLNTFAPIFYSRFKKFIGFVGTLSVAFLVEVLSFLSVFMPNSSAWSFIYALLGLGDLEASTVVFLSEHFGVEPWVFILLVDVVSFFTRPFFLFYAHLINNKEIKAVIMTRYLPDYKRPRSPYKRPYISYVLARISHVIVSLFYIWFFSPLINNIFFIINFVLDFGILIFFWFAYGTVGRKFITISFRLIWNSAWFVVGLKKDPLMGIDLNEIEILLEGTGLLDFLNNLYASKVRDLRTRLPPGEIVLYDYTTLNIRIRSTLLSGDPDFIQKFLFLISASSYDLFNGFVKMILFALFLSGIFAVSILLLLPLYFLADVGIFLRNKIFASLMAVFIIYLIPNFVFDVESFILSGMIDTLPKIIPNLFEFLGFAKLLMFFGFRRVEDHLAGRELPHTHTLKEAFKLFKIKRVKRFREVAVQIVRHLDTWRLPEGIRATYHAPTIATTIESFKILKDIGWPVDPNLVFLPESSDVALSDKLWASFSMFKSNFVVPLRTLTVAMATEMADFGFEDIPGFKHTATYTTAAFEIASTARYFQANPDIALPDSLFEDLWELVRPQYAFSVLTKPEEIIRKWVKKYNLGIGFWTEGRSGLRQMKRRQAIEKVGGINLFTDLWYKTLEVAGELTSLAPVFTKFETLKPAKKAAGLVRTVVGSALPHHIFTTIWNFFPNHNYAYWDTPMKVGMPLTGKAFGRLWEDLNKRENVFAGDMTAFDSSLAPQIVRLCAKIRKKGYEWHPDYSKICSMIDVAYEQLITQPLHLRSTGDVFRKTRGFSTGHSSTSADNSLALVACYLFAWKKLTGLKATDFMLHNSLVNFGDDHLLGYDDFPGWTPENIQVALREIGVLMKNEHPEAPVKGITGKSFLAKYGFKSAVEMAKVIKAGVLNPPTFMTYHDKRRLVGKIKGETLQRDRLQRHNRLVSYMALCAHHHDVYLGLVDACNQLRERFGENWQINKLKVSKIPSYNDVLYKWYTSDNSIKTDEMYDVKDEDFVDEDAIHFYTGPTALDSFNAVLSMVPEVLSPKYANASWIRVVHSTFKARFGWPAELLKARNPACSTLTGFDKLIDRTPYEFLTPDAIFDGTSGLGHLDLLLRHWLFMIIRFTFIGRSTSPTWWRAIETLDVTISDLIFAYDGTVGLRTVTLQWHFWSNLTVFLLGCLPPFFPNTQVFVPQILFDGFGALIARNIQHIWNSVQPAGRINFDPIRLAVLQHTSGDLGIMAPTGVGKSTRLIVKIREWTNRKIIVVEPRHVLTTSLYSYCSRVFKPTVYGAATSGGYVPKDVEIIYGTVQSLLLRTDLHDKRYLWIIDEAHIREPHYQLIKRFLRQKEIPTIWMTATPGSYRDEFTWLEMPALSNWKVFPREFSVPRFDDYLKAIVDTVEGTRTAEKYLVFLPTIKLAEKLQNMLSVRVCLLNSHVSEVDPLADVIITTKVADAGLTLPDVTVVFSTDLEVDVHTLKDENQSYRSTYKETSFYKLDDLTLMQRKGRTGRTNHGTFFLYRLEKETHVREHVYNPLDKILAIGDALEVDPQLMDYLEPDVREVYKMAKKDSLYCELPTGVIEMLNATPENTWGLGDSALLHKHGMIDIRLDKASEIV
jgi:hypothetical protein